MESPTVTIVMDASSSHVRETPVRSAIDQLRLTLADRGIPSTVVSRIEDASSGALLILVGDGEGMLVRSILEQAGLVLATSPEATALAPGRIAGRSALLATGRDVRGLVYAVRELADQVAHADDPYAVIQAVKPIAEAPANPIRSVTRMFVSDVEDKPWFNDRVFWKRYLSTLVTHRFNRLHLAFGIGHDFLRGVKDAYFLFAYPFLVSVAGYDVRAIGLSDDERDQNLAMLRFISDEARAVGLQFQLGLWTHGYSWVESPNPNYTIAGLTPKNHATYCRDALRTVLQSCPAITGVTLRVHGESGVPEGSHAFWQTVFDGMVKCGRPIDLDLHPKGLDRELRGIALATGLNVTISPKYTAEHMGLPYQQASIRELEREPRPSEGDSFVRNLMTRSGGDLRYTRYGYADFLEKDRPYGVLFRIWPGTQRLLLWGDPDLAAGFGRFGHFEGCLGVDYCEPLSFKGRRGSGSPGRDPYADASLRPKGDEWEKYHYTYRLFGRLLYNPEADPETWRRSLRHVFGPAAASTEAALASASRILPLVTTALHVSAANNRFWPEIYTLIPLVDAKRPHPYGDTPSPKRLGTVSPLDPVLFARIDDFADEVVSGRRSGKYSPLRVARWLNALADEAARNLSDAEANVANPADPEFRRLAIDVKIQVALGHFFAQLLRAGVGYALYQRTASRTRLREAVAAYRLARSAWLDAAREGQVYKRDLAIGGEPWLRGHWSDRLPAIDADVADLEAIWREVERDPKRELSADTDEVPLDALAPEPPTVGCTHLPPGRFERGQAVLIEIAIDDRSVTPGLHYRHVNQAQTYQEAEMMGKDRVFRFEIGGDYTDSPYALEYYFVLRRGAGEAWIYPGFDTNLANQPYVVIPQAE